MVILLVCSLRVSTIFYATDLVRQLAFFMFVVRISTRCKRPLSYKVLYSSLISTSRQTISFWLPAFRRAVSRSFFASISLVRFSSKWQSFFYCFAFFTPAIKAVYLRSNDSFSFSTLHFYTIRKHQFFVFFFKTVLRIVYLSPVLSIIFSIDFRILAWVTISQLIFTWEW